MMATAGALSKTVALLLLSVLSAGAIRHTDAGLAALPAKSEVELPGWPLPAAAQPAGINRAAAAAAAAATPGAALLAPHVAAGVVVAAAATERLAGRADKAALRLHPRQHHRTMPARLLPPGSLLRVAAAEGAVAAAASPLVQAADGPVHQQGQHRGVVHSSSSRSSSRSSSAGGNAAAEAPSSRVLVASNDQQDISRNSSSCNTTTSGINSTGSSNSSDCSTVKAHDGPPTDTRQSSTGSSSSSSSSGYTVPVTITDTQAPATTPTTGSSSRSSSSSSSSSSNVAPSKAPRLQPGDFIVRGGDDGSWRCIRRLGCKPCALAFGAAFRPLAAAGECQLMGGCEAVQKQGACRAPFSWEVDRRAAAVVQYCGEQCKCPGEN